MAERRRVLRRVSFAVVILVVLPLVTAAAVVLLVQTGYRSDVRTLDSDPFPRGERPAASRASENVLLIGSDTRGRLGDIAGGGPTGQRSDTLMLVHLPADGEDVQVMSIMRDLWVPIPGHGEGKVNAAFSLGGVPLTIRTVEALLDVRIDHVAVVDFAGFAAMSSTLGGVDVVSPKAFTSRNMPGYRFTAGINHVAGQRALAFVRERYAFPDADHQRVRNQQSFLRGVVDRLADRDGLHDLGRVRAFLGATGRSVTVDPGLTFTRAAHIGWRLRSVRPDDVAFFTLPTLGSGTSADGQSIVLQDRTAVAEIGRALRHDTLGDWVDHHHTEER
ncbi:LCP family protein [Curtobacterium sp. MCBD17_013]|uniref:LCP family protein n=1 Tax=Curtobacterium sp. MCBD17_013 TaxID=2175668 RepID=UPI0021ABCD6F|nr:LCP family protein [Curtobacterium sp. MCBD17_013]